MTAAIRTRRIRRVTLTNKLDHTCATYTLQVGGGYECLCGHVILPADVRDAVRRGR